MDADLLKLIEKRNAKTFIKTEPRIGAFRQQCVCAYTLEYMLARDMLKPHTPHYKDINCNKNQDDEDKRLTCRSVVRYEFHGTQSAIGCSTTIESLSAKTRNLTKALRQSGISLL
jgi:hypothetical protein